jgi:diguanylate cyclase (GGDEF)-like protein/PAS domain S-box-containing protein
MRRPRGCVSPATLNIMRQNILLITGSASEAKTVRDCLSRCGDQSFQIEWVGSCALAAQRLREGGKQHADASSSALAAVLLNLSLPDSTGIDTFDCIVAAAPHIPLLILSSAQDEASAKVAVRRGAQDYLLMDHVDDHTLPKAVSDLIDRAAIVEALFNEKERAQVTLNSIGDAVISTDVAGRVSYLNAVAEQLTGWDQAAAVGRPLEEVFQIIEAADRSAIADPMKAATLQNKTLALPPTCILIRRDGAESAIEDSVAPIHDRRGQVTGAVMVFRDVSKARALSQRLVHLAQHDVLTDLPNRDLLHDRLSHAMQIARRHQKPLAVLYLDLDRFKHINDSLGHMIGDRVLQAVALRLSECVRASDTVSRLGGDEFTVVAADLQDIRDAARCADKVLSAVRVPYVIDGHELHVTASIGIVLYPEDGVEVEALLQNADSAMYEAKDRGRDNYQFYRSDLNTAATEYKVLEAGLRQALQRGELELHYQTITDLATGGITGVEALIRWRHPQLGVVLPKQFIPVAEETGLIVPIGNWALREACRQAKAWQDGGLGSIRLAVNVSTVELRSRDFASGVGIILAQTGLDARCLVLELTETFLMEDSKATALVLVALKALGVQLALDDFGTGYSSLSFVRRFPIDVLKIDQSFVRDLSTDEGDASVVSAVISLGKSLHMRVVAEGVETLEQVTFLEQHGCPEAQGYYFNRPMPAASVPGLLRGKSSKPYRHAMT